MLATTTVYLGHDQVDTMLNHPSVRRLVDAAVVLTITQGDLLSNAPQSGWIRLSSGHGETERSVLIDNDGEVRGDTENRPA